MVKQSIRRNNQAVNFLKGLACICVIFIHHGFPDSIQRYVIGLARFAVPFFFMISGFYCFSNNQENDFANCLKKAARMLKLGFYMVLLYGIEHLILECVLEKQLFKVWIVERINWKTLLSFLILNDPPFSGMAWYLFAMAYVYFVAAIFSKYNLNKRITNVIWVLFIVHLVMGNVLTLFCVNVNVHYYMNWILFGLPCFYLGVLIKRNIKCFDNIKSDSILKMAFLFLLLSFFESHVFGNQELYIGSLGVSVFMLIWAMKNLKLRRFKFIQLLGKKASMYVYIFQSVVFAVIYKILWHTKCPSREVLWPIIGAIVTVIISYMYAVIIDWVKSNMLCSKDRQSRGGLYDS